MEPDETVEFLSKPYTREDLAHRLRMCLDRRGNVVQIASNAGSLREKASKLNVLLVEDEVLIRMTAAEMVVALGHKVFEAGSAQEALRILEDNAIDVLITDIGLPGISGSSLVAQARARWPLLSIVIASGYAGPEFSKCRISAPRLHGSLSHIMPRILNDSFSPWQWGSNEAI